MTESWSPSPQALSVVLRVLSRPETSSAEVGSALRAALLSTPREQGASVARPAYDLLRLLCQELPRSQWGALARERGTRDRDQAVWRLWRYLEEFHREEVESNAGSLAYHRTWLFVWFQDRYDLRSARRITGGRWVATNLHLVLLALVAVLFGFRQTGLFAGAATRWSVLGLGLAYLTAIGLLAGIVRRQVGDATEALALAQQSFVPRLAAAGLGGVVILASSEELLRLIVERASWLWLIGLLLAGYVYLLVEMVRRIHPLPRPLRLLFRALDVWSLALTHSLALALVAESALGLVLDPESGMDLTFEQSAAIAVFIFTIGLVVNLIWAEKPVTEPL